MLIRLVVCAATGTVSSFVATDIVTRNTCPSCNTVDERTAPAYVVDLTLRDKPPQSPSALAYSAKRTCVPSVAAASRWSPCASAAQPRLPPSIVVACGVRDPADMVVWREVDAAALGGGSTWLPPAVRIGLKAAAAWK